MVRIDSATDRKRGELLRSRMRETNSAASPVLRAMRGTALDREVPLQQWAFDENGELVGGLDGHVWARWLHVNLLWVDASYRGTGLGSRLLAGAEDAARSLHGCQGSRVTTWDFQAPYFYRKQGYEVVCAIPGYPQGVTEFTFTKKL